MLPKAARPATEISSTGGTLQVHFGDLPLRCAHRIGDPGGQVKRQCAESATCSQMPSFAVAGRIRVTIGSLILYHHVAVRGERDGRTPPGTSPPDGPAEDRLDSWKEIAAYLGRDVTTVQRWEKREGMPVHRHVHDKRGSVYAVGSELDAWLQSRSSVWARRTKTEGPRRPWKRKTDVDKERDCRCAAGLLWQVLIVLGLLAVAYFASRGRTDSAAQPKIRSLAVLPLKNLSGDPAQEYLADGMTDALIGRLSSIHDLRVISRTSVMRFKNPQLSVPEIAKMLQRGRDCGRLGDARRQSDSRHRAVDSRRDRRALLVGNLRSRTAGCV